MNGDKEKNPRKYDLEDRLIDFPVRIIKLADSLPRTSAGNHIAGQILRSGTSPAPNYGEAQSAESRKDFIHKMKISLKELRETKVWLKIIQKVFFSNNTEKVTDITKECDELIAIFVTSVKTTEKNKNS